MTVGALRVELFISNSDSLKAKRSVIKAMKDRIGNKFNVSISEVDDHDKWQKTVFGIACVGPDKRHVNEVLDKVMDFIRGNGDVQVLDYQMEII